MRLRATRLTSIANAVRNLFGSASLNLNFTGKDQQLDPRITFTRASTATFFNSSGVLQTAAANIPRLDHDPVTLEPKGLLIEDQRTNSIRNNTMQGAVAGTPGTYPTNWNVPFVVDGLTREIVGTGTTNGITWIDVRWSGTTTAAGSTVTQPESVTAITAATGQSWSASAWWAIVGGSTANITAVTQRVTGRSAAGSFLERADTPVTLTATLTRYAVSRTMANASTARVTNDILFTYSIGVPIDITLRIGMPQLELGAFATSVIPTFGTAATRALDVAVMTGTNFSSWYQQDEGTLFAEYSYSVTGVSNLCAYSLDNGTANETIVNATATPNIDRVLSSAGGVSQANFGNFNYIVGQVVKRAVAVKLNNAATTANGSAVATDNSYTMPVPTQLTIGAAGYFTSSRINGHIRRIAYFRRRLSNEELQRITS